MINSTISFAQNREDIFLAGFFKEIKNGFYVDIGANDPYVDSVTKYFYDIGWRGINIEPIKRHFEMLVKDRPRDINLNIGVGEAEGTLTLREYEGSGLSTFSEDMQRHYKENPTQPANVYVDYKVPMRTLESIFKECKTDMIHFLKVDVEGYEYEVLKSNDWNIFRPQVICIEANHIKNDWHPMLIKHGYSLAISDGLNEYHIDTTLSPKLSFDYVKAVIDREPIVSSKLLSDFAAIKNESAVQIERLQAENGNLQQEVDQLKNEVVLVERYVQDLLRRLDDIASLRKHSRKVVVKHLRRLDDKIMYKLNKSSQFSPAQPTLTDGDLKAMQRAAFDADELTRKAFLKHKKLPASIKYYNAQKKIMKKIIKRSRNA